LYDLLVEHFSAEQVFKDVDNIAPGEDFVERITTAVGSCDLLLALIGPDWLTITDEKGERRLDKPEDYVRLEVETALKRQIRLIPILVDPAQMPHADELPPSLALLARRNAVEINPDTFDTKRLITAVQNTLVEEQARRRAQQQDRQLADEQARKQAKHAQRQADEEARQHARRPPRALVWSWVLFVVFVAAAVIGYLLWGGAAGDMPNRAQVWSPLLAAIVIVLPVVLGGWRRQQRAVVGTSTRPQADAAADTLAGQTFNNWSR
jgi:hypothetical protein